MLLFGIEINTIFKKAINIKIYITNFITYNIFDAIDFLKEYCKEIIVIDNCLLLAVL